jgi:hypothetical protein
MADLLTKSIYTFIKSICQAQNVEEIKAQMAVGGFRRLWNA